MGYTWNTLTIHVSQSHRTRYVQNTYRIHVSQPHRTRYANPKIHKEYMYLERIPARPSQIRVKCSEYVPKSVEIRRASRISSACWLPTRSSPHQTKTAPKKQSKAAAHDDVSEGVDAPSPEAKKDTKKRKEKAEDEVAPLWHHPLASQAAPRSRCVAECRFRVRVQSGYIDATCSERILQRILGGVDVSGYGCILAYVSCAYL